MKSILLNIFLKLWYAFVTIIIVMALMVTLARGLTPLLNHHKANFESWASQLIGAPVQVGYLSAWWEGFQPDIEFKNVQIFNKDKTQTQLQVDKLNVTVNVIGSLFHRRLQPNSIMLDGAHVIIYQQQDKSFQLSGFQNQSISHQSSPLYNSKALIDWISFQKYLGLRNVSIDYYPYQGKLIPIHIDSLNLANNKSQHVLSGLVGLVEPQKTNVNFALMINGELQNFAQQKIQAYVQLKNFQVTSFPMLPKFYGYQITQGIFSGQIWFDWDNQQLQSLQSLFNVSEVQLVSDKAKKPLILNAASGNILWQPLSTGWQLSGDNINVATPDQIWPKNKFNLILTKNDQQVSTQQLWIHYLNIADVQKLLLSGSFPIPEKLQQLSTSLNLQGKLNDFFIAHTGDMQHTSDFHFSAQFNHVSFNRWHDVPGVTNLSGAVDFSPAQGVAEINAANVTLDFGSLFPQTLFANQLSGNVTWKQNYDKAWLINASELTAINSFISLYGDAGVLIPFDGTSPTVSILAGFDFNDTSQVHYYLPVGILQNDVARWLKEAFISGDGGQGTVIIRGPIEKFPFDQHEGTFIISGDVHKTEFHYAPGWPNAKDVVAKLIFEGRTMSCAASQGGMYGLNVDYFNANIPYMGHEKPNHLLLDGSVQGDADNMLQYLRNTPLQNTLGAATNHIDMKGNTAVKINIDIPLDDPDKTTLNGNALFHNAVLELPAWNLSAGQVNGKLLFTQDAVNSQGLSVDLFDQPTNLSIQTVKDKQKFQQTILSFKNHFQLVDLLSRFGWPSFSDIHGEFDTNTKITLHSDHTDNRPNLLQVTSDLKGLAIDMPEPLTKQADVTLPMTVDYSFNGDTPTQLHINLQNKMDALFVFSSINNQLGFVAGNVLFGEGEAELSRNAHGLYINAHFPIFDWQTWRDYYNAKMASQKDKSAQNFVNNFKQELTSIKLYVDNITLFQQAMQNASFQFTPQLNGWQIGIDSPNIIGSVLVPTDYNQAGISGSFDRLYLQPSTSSIDKTIIPGEIPPLTLQIKRFHYGNQNFGAINLKTSPSGNNLMIRSLNVNSPLLTGNLTGSWNQISSGVYQSQLSATLSSNNISSLLKTFGFQSSAIVNQGNATFHLTWPGPIYQWTIDQLQGNVAINFGSGRIVDLGESATQSLNLGRLITLLSIDRLIHMDFSDYTKKGYSFETMKGNLTLNRGSIVTQDLALNGSVADISIKGACNLLNKTVDLDLSVLPHTASSVPIIAAFAINPLVGAAAWGANKLLGKEVGKLTGTRYKVTGNWQSPVVQKL